MHLLPGVLIALALLPLSSGLQCHTEEIADGIVVKARRKGHCNDSVAFCLVLDVPKVNTTVRGCELPGTCTAAGCSPLMLQGLRGSQCCCNEDLCNDNDIDVMRSATFAPMTTTTEAAEGDWDANFGAEDAAHSSSAACPTILISLAAVAAVIDALS
ncbi:hypothetical protein PRIPAC_88771 [Pristionchus pacificus]|uniref:Uncharacterized protein n=1 Tax=Pristionchus pacificus TaxID=54126 RepID=A0A454Y0K1_PRIPA|nr:hypothetical protein PRIPAC_88771 [Pristionchus pacificus]|eukprot:PDM62552.1 hypothetical protein PRIPAC_51994 [Pristionchus pacificus]